MAAFARDTMNSVAATGRLATNMGLAVDQVSTLGRVFERSGGSADSAMGFLKGYTDQVARLRIFGEGAESWAKIGLTGVTPDMNALQALIKFAEYAEKHRSDASGVSAMGQLLGLDPAMINRALKGPRQLLEDLKKAQLGALTPEQAEAMERMQESWVRLDQAVNMVGRDLVADVAPAFTSIANSVGGWVEHNSRLAESLGGVLTALTAITALKPAAWLLRLLGLGGAATVAEAAPGIVGKVVTGGGIGGAALNVAEAMKYDSQHGNSLRTMLRQAFGIEDPGEAAPWAGALPGKGGSGTSASGGSGAAASGGTGAFGSPQEKEAFIRQAAKIFGIDPDVAMHVSRHEGFNAFTGDNGTSFGAFQLHVTRGGRGHAVGDEFKAATGLDPANPANEAAGIVYSLQWIRDHGWGDFHGAANSGISQWQGINQGLQTDVQIGSITINTRATDAAGIARDIHSELKGRFISPSAIATQANTGLTP
jgi:hypothetical protein